MPAKREAKRDASGRYGGVKNANAYAKMMAKLDDETARNVDQHHTKPQYPPAQHDRGSHAPRPVRLAPE